MSNRPKQPQNVDTLKLNKEIAYKGAIGQKREAFCIDYIKKKKEIIKQFHDDQVKTASNNGETISCQRGCTYCCLVVMHANVQECEAIVYYLYHHEIALSAFLKNFKKWRKQLRQNGDLFKECAQLWQNKTTLGANQEAELAYQESLTRYQNQNIYCPFLQDNVCLIYDVRPFSCAALIATTPAQYCSPSRVKPAKYYVTRTPVIFDTSFYFNKIDEIILAFMPLVVYGIIKDGYKLLSNFRGLEELEKTAMEDAQVRENIKRLGFPLG